MATIAELLGQPEIDQLAHLRTELGQHQDAAAAKAARRAPAAPQPGQDPSAVRIAPPAVFSDGTAR